MEIVYADLTGDLNGDPAIELGATLALLGRGFCETRGILNCEAVIQALTTV